MLWNALIVDKATRQLIHCFIRVIVDEYGPPLMIYKITPFVD